MAHVFYAKKPRVLYDTMDAALDRVEGILLPYFRPKLPVVVCTLGKDDESEFV